VNLFIEKLAVDAEAMTVVKKIPKLVAQCETQIARIKVYLLLC